MKLTNEQIQAILDGAPDGEQHINIPVAGGLTHKVHRIGDLREILELRQEVERLKAQQSEVVLNAYAVAYKEGFGDGLETDKSTIDGINRTTSSINLYEYNLSNIAKCKAYKYANQLREQGK